LLAAQVEPIHNVEKAAAETYLAAAYLFGAGWSSPVARQAHNLKVAGSNPAPATNVKSLATPDWIRGELRICVVFADAGTQLSDQPPSGGFFLLPGSGRA
jgi:hypothetical protein